MLMKDMLSSFVERWAFTRSETLAVLNNLTDEQLLFKPEGRKWKPLYWQFTCAARTQLVYAHAVAEGRMDFSLFHDDKMPSKDDYTTKKDIKAFMEYADKHWLQAILHSKHADAPIVWPAAEIPLVLHISGLMEHERMHLGQLISYHTIAGYDLPKSFKDNWSL